MQIERIREEIQDKNEKRRFLDDKIERIKVGLHVYLYRQVVHCACQNKWLPKLEELIATIGEKFSDGFDRMYIRD